VIGPLLDRVPHGRRAAMATAMLARVLLALLLSNAVVTGGLELYPAALGVLVASKAYGVVRSAVVPRLLPPRFSLVKANSRVTLCGLLATGAAAPIGAWLHTVGPRWPLYGACVIFVAGTILSFQLPPKVDSGKGEDRALLAADEEHLHGLRARQPRRAHPRGQDRTHLRWLPWEAVQRRWDGWRAPRTTEHARARRRQGREWDQDLDADADLERGPDRGPDASPDLDPNPDPDLDPDPHLERDPGGRHGPGEQGRRERPWESGHGVQEVHEVHEVHEAQEVQEVQEVQDQQPPSPGAYDSAYGSGSYGSGAYGSGATDSGAHGSGASDHDASGYGKPEEHPEPQPSAEQEFREPHQTERDRNRRPGLRTVGPAVTHALLANAVLRCLSGFLIFFLAFLLREQPLAGQSAAVSLGMVAVAAGTGNALGTAVGSWLKSRAPELIIVTVVGLVLGVAIAAAGLFSAVLVATLAAVAGFAQALAKLSLDALIQRDVPEVVRTSAFARSETLLQMAWVVGGGIGIALPLNGTLGISVAAAIVATGWLATVRGLLRSARHGTPLSRTRVI
jgi:hypothetical protein